MRIRVTDEGRTGWGELLVDRMSIHSPILFYQGSLWSAEAALRKGLQFHDWDPSALHPDSPARRVWVVALVRAAILEQTQWTRLAGSAIWRFLTATR